MNSKYNLDFVPPHRREEVRRRIRVLDEFINEGGGRTSAASRAAEVGIATSQFYSLVRVWKSSKDPKALFGAGHPPAKHDRLRSEQRHVINEAMLRIPDASHEAISRMATAIAQRRGVEMPVFSTIRQYVRRQHRGRLPSTSPAIGVDLVIEHCAINVGILGPTGGAFMPIATICTSVPDGEARAVSLSLEVPTAGAAAVAILCAVKASNVQSSKGTLAVFLDLLPGPGWDELGQAMKAAGIERVGTTRQLPRRPDATMALLGSRVASLTFHPRMTNRELAARPAKLPHGASPVRLDQAEEYIRARLLRPDAPVLTLNSPTGETLTRLISDLTQIRDK